MRMKTIRYFALLVASACAIVSMAVPMFGAAAREAGDSVQFNALDYRLQPVAGNERFKERKFGDRLFLTAEGGVLWNGAHNSTVAIGEPGAMGGLSIGDWFTPVHGMRIGINTGSQPSQYGGHPYFIGGTVDYLMNLSSLVRKDNPDRKFEVIGALGLGYQALKYKGTWKQAFGVNMGLQLRYNATPSTFIYVEPRLGVYTDGLDGVSTWKRYDWRASVMLGLGYRMPWGRTRREGVAEFKNQTFADNIIYGISGSMSGIVNKGLFTDLKNRVGFEGTMFIGKWITATSGIRLSGTIGKMGRTDIRRPMLAMIDLDYMWNLNSAFAGYRPGRHFETNISLGGVVAAPGDSDGHTYLGFGAGIQWMWNMTPTLGLYIEPRVRVFNKNFSDYYHTDAGSNIDMLASVSLGLRYQVDASGYRSRQNAGSAYSGYDAARRDYEDSRKFFITVAGGPFSNVTSFDSNSAAFFIGLGKWFTPASAWRLTADYQYHMSGVKYMTLGLGADYMLSLSSLSCGFDPDRIFDVTAIAGLYGGVAQYSRGRNEFAYGLKAGLQGRFRLSRSIDLFIEPQLLSMHLGGYSSRTLTPEFRIMAGLTYKLGGNRRRGQDGAPSAMTRRNFISVEGGPSMFSESLVNGPRKLSGAVDAMIGRWMTPSSGLQLGVSYDFINAQLGERANIGTLHADYLLSFTSLFEYDPERSFDVIGLIGGGFAWSDYRSRKGWSAEGGLKFNWAATSDIDIYLKPIMTVWDKRLFDSASNGHPFIGVGRVMVGMSWRF